MYTVIDPFYEADTTSATERCARGQLWWTCFPYAFTNTEVTRFWPHRPTEKLDIARFDPRRERYDHRASTSADEFLAITQFKRRPVVIISTCGTQYRNGGWRGAEFFLVAPARSLRDSLTREYKPSPHFVWSVITYRFSSLFYLPRDSNLNIREAVLHFDRIIALHRSWLLEPMQACLSGDALICLDEWLRNYIYGLVRTEFNRDLECYRQLVGEDPEVRTGVFGKSI
jgi:hypothetical protein